MILPEQDTSKKLFGSGSINNICGLVADILSLNLQLHFYGLKTKQSICHAPFWQGFKLHGIQLRIYVIDFEADSLLIQQSP